MKTDIGRLTADWEGIQSVVLYGAGIVGRICMKLFERIDLKIPFVIDQDKRKQGSLWRDAPIISYEDAKAQISKQKIVVMAGHTAYGEITKFLDAEGLIEFRDFCNVGQFMSEWMWNARKLNCVFHVDMTITTKCTLSCKHCNLFIPYHSEHINFPYEEMQRNIDLFFERIDFVTYFGLIGGETFLHPDLQKIIRYLGDNYGNQIGRITVVTNGTVPPDDTLLEVMKNYEIYLSISDYTDIVAYENKMERLIKKLKEYEIDYFRNSSIVWTDFGFPEHPLKRTPEQMEEHLKCCRPNWNALHDEKFYYCNVAWCAQQSGHFNLCEEDSLKLTEIPPEDREACRQIVELSRGTSSFCRICGGCGIDNVNYVKPGVQVERKQHICFMGN